MSKYVLSRMANAVAYTVYGDSNEGAIPPIKKKLIVAGGAGSPDYKIGFGNMTRDGNGTPLWTPEGVVTTFSDADFDILKAHPVFRRHLEQGLVKEVNYATSENHKLIEKAVQDMSADPFALLSSSTVDRRVKVTTGGPDSEEGNGRI